MKNLIAIAFAAVFAAGCSSANTDAVKAQAPAVWQQAGFEVIGYEGYNLGLWAVGSYGGAYVWYTVKRIPDNGVIYHGSIQRWGDEYHIYNLGAIDAIKAGQ